VRAQILEEEFGDRLQLEWRSFLLRPKPEGSRNKEKFRKYTQGWSKIADDEPSGEFNPWTTDESPPSHSIPPHLIAKAAATISDEAFHTVHDALLKAYFTDNRDVSSEDNLKAIWGECGLPSEEFERARNPELLKTVIDEHNEALSYGASGAPAFRMSHHDVAIVGAHPVEVLSRWINRVLDDKV